jgi:hypothetical protein
MTNDRGSSEKAEIQGSSILFNIACFIGEKKQELESIHVWIANRQ